MSDKPVELQLAAVDLMVDVRPCWVPWDNICGAELWSIAYFIVLLLRGSAQKGANKGYFWDSHKYWCV